MKIKWFGTASLLIETDKYKLLFDPYLKSMNKTLPDFPLDEIKDVDAIFISHPHFDHFSDIPTVTKYTNCPIYTNRRGIEIAKHLKYDMSRIREMHTDDVFEFGNSKITIYQGRHIVFDLKNVHQVIRRVFRGQLIGGIKIKRANRRFRSRLKDVNSFLITENKKSVFIMGSANIDKNIVYPKFMDLLVFPYQGRSNMLAYSYPLVKSFKPKQILVDHYDDAFPPVSKRMNVEEFKEKIESESDISVIIPKENELIEI